MSKLVQGFGLVELKQGISVRAKPQNPKTLKNWKALKPKTLKCKPENSKARKP